MAAFTVTALTPYHESQAEEKIGEWAIMATSADASACESLKAAVTGYSHYIQEFFISCATAATVTIGAGETGGDVTAALIGPVHFLADGGTFVSFKFDAPLKVAVSTAIVGDTSAIAPVTIYLKGYTK